MIRAPGSSGNCKKGETDIRPINVPVYSQENEATDVVRDHRWRKRVGRAGGLVPISWAEAY